MSEPPSFLPGPVVDSGLLVLSRFPILMSHFESYNIGILSDSASDKGYIYCKIKIGDSILHLFVTHLQASYIVPGQELQRQLSVKVRMYQSGILISRIKQLLKTNDYKGEELVMLVGDLNIDSREQPFRLSYLVRTQKQLENQSRNSLTLTNPLLNGHNTQFFEEFKHFRELFSEQGYEITDHLYDREGVHLPTFGDNEYILTDHSESTSRQRLDFIFTLKPTQSMKATTLTAQTGTCEVQKYLRPSQKYGLLSDHYGLSIQIN